MTLELGGAIYRITQSWEYVGGNAGHKGSICGLYRLLRTRGAP